MCCRCSIQLSGKFRISFWKVRSNRLTAFENRLDDVRRLKDFRNVSLFKSNRSRNRRLRW